MTSFPGNPRQPRTILAPGRPPSAASVADPPYPSFGYRPLRRRRRRLLRRPFRNPWRRLWWGSVLLGVLLASVLAVGLWRDLQTPLGIEAQPVLWEVKEGSNLHSLMGELETAGHGTPPLGLYLYAVVRGWDRRIQQGEYRLMPGDSYQDLLRKIVYGDVHLHRITFIEGWTLGQAVKEMHARSETIIPALRGLPLGDMLRELRLHGWQCPKDTGGLELRADRSAAIANLEGLFFPDTYLYQKGARDVILLRKAHREMCQHMGALWKNRSSGLPYKSPYEVLIMASILEKEAMHLEERARMAGVFVRRLERNMRLEADPTVVYGLGADFEGPLLFSHLRKPSPYNTYLNRGLPPTPIAMPGRHSLYAALHPRREEAIYFVRTPDDSGAHIFSATLEEHRKAVKRWRSWKRSQGAAKKSEERS